jgi:2-oxoglutarate ferredoxin oxidoreductase subunit beta
MTNIQAHAAKGEVLTGLLYVNPDSTDLHAHLNTCKTPFNTLGEKDLCPGSAILDKINASLR